MSTLSRRSFVLASGAAAITVPAALAVPEVTQAAAPTFPVTQETNPFFFSLANAAKSTIPGGVVQRCTKAVFPVLNGVAVFSLALEKGAARRSHMHTNANELSYIASGAARAGIIGPAGQREVFTLQAGDLVFFPQGWMHWLENIGDGPLFSLFMYSNEQPVTIDLSDINDGVTKGGGY